MDKRALLAELRVIANTAPDLERATLSSRAVIEWLARAHALVALHAPLEAISLKTSTDFLSNPLMRPSNSSQIVNIVYRTIAALDVEVGRMPAGAYGPGAVYDFLRGLRDLLASAQREVFIIDPYMNAEVFDTYVSAASVSASVRLLLRDRDGSLKPAMVAFTSQNGRVIEARHSTAIHDRVVLVDRLTAWVLGQSIKDAAKSKSTYLAPLPPDVSSLKLGHYEAIWSSATPL